MRPPGPGGGLSWLASLVSLVDHRASLASLLDRLRQWRDQRIADPAFRRWAARFPLTRPIAQRRAQALFDLVAGFSYSQVLLARRQRGSGAALYALARIFHEQ